jgi:hypothetical protein
MLPSRCSRRKKEVSNTFCVRNDAVLLSATLQIGLQVEGGRGPQPNQISPASYCGGGAWPGRTGTYSGVCRQTDCRAVRGRSHQIRSAPDATMASLPPLKPREAGPGARRRGLVPRQRQHVSCRIAASAGTVQGAADHQAVSWPRALRTRLVRVTVPGLLTPRLVKTGGG